MTAQAHDVLIVVFVLAMLEILRLAVLLLFLSSVWPYVCSCNREKAK